MPSLIRRARPALAPTGTPQVDFNHHLAQGLAGAWYATEGGGLTLTDASRFRQDATPAGTVPSWVVGPHGCASSLPTTSGISGWIAPPRGPDLFPNSDPYPITIVAWVNLSSYATANGTAACTPIFTVGEQHDNNYSYCFEVAANGNLLLVADPARTSGINGTGVVPLNAWHMVGVVLRGTSDRTFWIDTTGEINTAAAGAATITAGNPYCLGAAFRNSGPYSSMVGKLGPVLLYSRALADAEMQELAHNPYAMLMEPRWPTIAGAMASSAATLFGRATTPARQTALTSLNRSLVVSTATTEQTRSLLRPVASLLNAGSTSSRVTDQMGAVARFVGITRARSTETGRIAGTASLGGNASKPSRTAGRIGAIAQLASAVNAAANVTSRVSGVASLFGSVASHEAQSTMLSLRLALGAAVQASQRVTGRILATPAGAHLIAAFASASRVAGSVSLHLGIGGQVAPSDQTQARLHGLASLSGQTATPSQQAGHLDARARLGAAVQQVTAVTSRLSTMARLGGVTQTVVRSSVMLSGAAQIRLAASVVTRSGITATGMALRLPLRGTVRSATRLAGLLRLGTFANHGTVAISASVPDTVTITAGIPDTVTISASVPNTVTITATD